jgi:PBP1b-binding outer membrane lipoprotein LpoB
MKKRLLNVVCGLMVFVMLAACSSSPRVNRVDADSQVDLSGEWNDTDVRLACESLVADCLKNPRVVSFIEQYAAEHKGALPTVIVGGFSNKSSEHIDKNLISRGMERALINSGRLEFVAGGETRQELRTERQDQLANASDDTIPSLGNETAAIFMLTGSVESIVKKVDNVTSRYYSVSAELTNIETTSRWWMGLNEINTVIHQSKARIYKKRSKNGRFPGLACAFRGTGVTMTAR